VEGHVCTAFRHFTFVDFILKSQQENEWIQGKKLSSKGDFARAEQCFRIWIQKKDVDPEGYLGLAYCLAQQRKLPDAIELLEKAVSLAPYERVYFNNLGTLYAENGNLIKAMEMYQRVGFH
jgi:Flp pilus assembly protein TadD